METCEVKQLDERFLNLASAYYNMTHRMLTLFSGSQPGKLLCSRTLDPHRANLQRELVLFLLALYEYVQHLDKAAASGSFPRVSPFEDNVTQRETVDALAQNGVVNRGPERGL